MFFDPIQGFAFDDYATMQVSSGLENNFKVVDEIESAHVPNPITREDIPFTGRDCPFATWTPTEFESAPSIPIPLRIFDFPTNNLPNIHPNAKFGYENTNAQKRSLNQPDSNSNVGSCIKEAPISLLETVGNMGFMVMSAQNGYTHARFQSTLIPQEPIFSGALGTTANSPILDHFAIDFLDDELTASSGNSRQLISLVCFYI